MRSPCPSVASRGMGKGGKGKGFSEEAGNGGHAAGGCRVELSHISAGSAQRSKGADRAGGLVGREHQGPGRVPRAAAVRPSLHLQVHFLGQVQRTPPGEELAEPQAAGGGQKKGDKTTPGGGGANRKGDGSRLLRDLRVDTKSRAAWARLLHEHPNARKYKGGNKKGLSKGCFGLKLDRIGSMSGLGC